MKADEGPKFGTQVAGISFKHLAKVEVDGGQQEVVASVGYHSPRGVFSTETVLEVLALIGPNFLHCTAVTLRRLCPDRCNADQDRGVVCLRVQS